MAANKASALLLGKLLDKVQEHDERASKESLDFNLSFLKDFGYLNGTPLEDLTIAKIIEAVKTFQGFYGLEQDGVISTQTSRAMLAPRCGCLDCEPEDSRVQRLKALKSIWRKRELTYYFDSYVNGLPKDVIEGLEAAAWGDWMAVADIKVSQTNDKSKADIVISTGRGRRDQFDGPGNTLAWAYLPDGADGQLLKLYDLDESWADSLKGSAREILYRNVSCHESGHLLGLEHSTKGGALMAPYYSPTITGPQQVDDITRIQGLYGAAQAPAPTDPVPPPTTPTDPTAPTAPTLPPVPAGAKRIVIDVVGDITAATLPGFRTTKFGG